MIEQVLKRFVSSGTKLVLAAMDKAGPQAMPYSVEAPYRDMISNAVASGSVVDAFIIRRADARINKEKERARKHAAAQAIATEMLMSDDIKTLWGGEKKALGPTSQLSLAQSPALQHRYLQRMGQQMQDSTRAQP